MRVRCVAELPSPEQAAQMKGQYFPGRQVFGVTVGQEYLVFGLYFNSGVPWVHIENEYGYYLVPTPLCLFEIIDGRLSKHWVAKVLPTGDLGLWPPSFHAEYYFDDLFEGVEDVVADFQTVRAAMYEEVAEAGDP